ncbi:MAG: glycosyl hydrolase family 28 protein, partial [Anaerolineae bacterium]|nr:glycosyl hydrolase family 28 protein [Anaerolineae bacterium]
MTTLMPVVYDIRDYGASAAGLASPGINAAVRACAAAGGGTVFVPPGIWRCGTIELASGIRLYLSAGATLQSSLDLADFYQVAGMLHGKALIAAYRCQNVSITGDGCIDGRGPEFMDWSRTFPAQGRYDESNEGAALPRERVDRLVYFDQCNNVCVSGIRLREAACWCLNLVGCEDVWCTNLAIFGHERIPNNDGIHLCYCRRVTIHGCHIHSADDAIALTSEKGGNSDNDALHWSQEEMRNPPWCEDITISDCILQTRGSGVRIGFMDDFVRRVRIHDCLLPDCHRGFLVSARNNGRVEDVLVHDCCLSARLYAGVWWGGAEPFQVSAMGAGNGRIRNIEFRGIDAESEHGAVLWTDARFPVSDVRLHDCRIRLQASRHAATLGGYLDLRPRSTERDIPSGYFKHEIPGIYAHRIAG